MEKVKKNTNPQLQPIRDIDGHIQTFSPKMIYVDSTPYEDCFERMSFEKENMGDDFWRDDELYDSQLDYRTSLNEKYSYNDIPSRTDFNLCHSKNSLTSLAPYHEFFSNKLT